MNLSVDLHRLLPIAAVGFVALLAALLVTRGLREGSTTAGARQVFDRALQTEPRSGAVNMRVNAVLQSQGRSITVADTVLTGVGAEAQGGRPRQASMRWSERLAGQKPVQVDELASGNRGYIRVDGVWYRLSPAQTNRVFASTGNGETLIQSLGFDPRHWLTDPKLESTNAHVGGVRANQISGDVDVQRVLADLGLYKGAAAARAQQFAGASGKAHVDLFAGKQDGILRRMSATAETGASKNAPPLRGTLTFTLGIDKVNEPVKVTEPKNALPPSRIAAIPRAKLGTQADKVLGPPPQAKPSGTGGQRRTPQQRHAAGTRTKPSGQAYVSCVQGAQDLAALERCQALLP